jgi:hypothetical protein
MGIAAFAIIGFILLVVLSKIFGSAFSGDSVSGSSKASEDGRSDRKKPRLASDLGPDWVFGNWQFAELAWCRAAYNALGAAAAPEQRA